MKNFSAIFGESWKEYKANFRVFLIIFLLLSAIPTLILFFLGTSLNSEITVLGNEPTLEKVFETIYNSNYFLPLVIAYIIIFALGILMSTSFIYNSLYRKKGKKMSISETLAGGRKYFFKFLFFSIVYWIFIAGLLLLFIIPGIIFMVFWVFSFYILIGENKGIMESLKTSRNLIRGKWWRTLGFIVLFAIIIIGISIVFSIVAGIISLVLTLSGQAFIGEAISQILSLGVNLISAPLGVLFFKNLYLDYKGKK